jgi:predicted DNA-binding transcriptional regulator YafY
MSEPTKGNAIRRTVRLFDALLKGETLERHRAAKIAGTNHSAAYDQLVVFAEELTGVRQIGRGKGASFRFDLNRHLGATDATLVGACFAVALSALFAGSKYGNAMKAAFRELLRRSQEPELFELHEKKFVFARGGGDIAVERSEFALDQVVEALLHNKYLRINYDPVANTPRKERISPLSIVLYQHQLYLLGRRMDGTLHPFRLARIKAATALRKKFTYPADIDPQAILDECFGIHLGREHDSEKIRVRVTGPWAKFAKTHRWHATQTLHHEGPDSVVVELKVRCCPEIETWVLGLGDHATVLEPEHLRLKIADRLRRAMQAYTSAGKPPARTRMEPLAKGQSSFGRSRPRRST